MLEKGFPHEGVVALQTQLSKDNDDDGAALVRITVACLWWQHLYPSFKIMTDR